MASPGFALTKYKSVLIAAWATPDPEGIRAAASLMQEMTKDKKPAAFICVVNSKMKLPNEEFRFESAKLIGDVGHALSASAIVVEGQGLMGVAMRSVITGLRLVARLDGEMKSFKDIPDAVKWLAPYASLEGDLEALQRACEACRQGLPVG